MIAYERDESGEDQKGTNMKKQPSCAESITVESYEYIKETSCLNILEDFWNGIKFLARSATARCFKHPKIVPTEHIPQRYAYIFRKKSLWELILLGATVCGIGFCYAAETAFVTPLLLSLGMKMKYLTMTWCLSPFIAFLLTPILGSVSDVCSSKIGRRRPFIIGLSTCILIGFFLVPYGRQIGIALGDVLSSTKESNNGNKSIEHGYIPFLKERNEALNGTDFQKSLVHNLKASTTASGTNYLQNSDKAFATKLSPQQFSSPESPGDLEISTKTDNSTKFPSENTLLFKSVVFTVLGTILIDSCCDICQSPCRAYMLDVTLPEDHAIGLSVFSLMTGFGAGLGYCIGAIEWNVPVFGNLLEGQVIIVFAIISIVFVICLISTLTSFPELPLSVFKDPETHKEFKNRYLDVRKPGHPDRNGEGKSQKESTVFSNKEVVGERSGDNPGAVDAVKSIEQELSKSSMDVSLKQHLKSIIRMPKSLFRLCLVNFFTCITIVTYNLFFTDFMGEYVFGGNPHAEQSSPEYTLFEEGVRYGCWGMALASFFCSFYSLFIGKLIEKFGTKFVYIGGHIVAFIGFLIMVIAKNFIAAIILSSVSGVIFGTAFTIPFLLVAQYHSSGMEEYVLRGVGTDVATVTSMMVLSQFIVSLTLGMIAEAIGSNATTIGATAAASACAAVSALFVTYPDEKQTT